MPFFLALRLRDWVYGYKENIEKLIRLYRGKKSPIRTGCSRPTLSTKRGERPQQSCEVDRLISTLRPQRSQKNTKLHRPNANSAVLPKKDSDRRNAKGLLRDSVTHFLLCLVAAMFYAMLCECSEGPFLGSNSVL